MKTYIVELRDNHYGVTEADPCVGYLGFPRSDRPDREGSPALGCVTDRAAANEYEHPTQHRYDTRKLSDEFHDRYFMTVVETEAYDETAEAFEDAMNNPSND